MMTYFVILTMQTPTSRGMGVCSFSNTVTARPGATRSELLEWAKSQLAPEYRNGGNVMFFHAEPNELGR